MNEQNSGPLEDSALEQVTGGSEAWPSPVVEEKELEYFVEVDRCPSGLGGTHAFTQEETFATREVDKVYGTVNIISYTKQRCTFCNKIIYTCW